MPPCVHSRAESLGGVVVLSYHDGDDTDDVPDDGSEIAGGFERFVSTHSSKYIGNDALGQLDIATAELCLWSDVSASSGDLQCERSCIAITASTRRKS